MPGRPEKPLPESAILRVRLTPKGGRDALDRCEGDVLHARVAAPPVEGAANRALIVLLAETLDVAKSRITLVSGQTGREKVVRIEGLDADALQARLEAALPH
ncbi:MAG TPA: DUF167 domain-containing protein [Chthonomonadaceae bacterium]|nr:DUF167 domain-containing protein [Chthonomonadaceae bacterium]